MAKTARPGKSWRTHSYVQLRHSCEAGSLAKARVEVLMPAKCPLCFRRLDGTQQLERVCLSHKDRPHTFAFDIDRPKDLYCGIKSCENPRSIPTRRFLRHVGCAAKNPYWRPNSGAIAIPEADTLERDDKVFHVQHWMFGVLKELAENALAIARTDQTRHVERTHLSPRLVAQASQKRLEPTPKLVSPIQRPLSHGRPLQKPTTHKSQKN